MTHRLWHDPIEMLEECETCNGLVRRTFNALADLDLGPRDAETLVAKIREISRELARETYVLALPAPYDWDVRGDFA